MGLIVLMIDGVSADTFASERGRMPHLNALAANGTTVERLGAEVPGTSLPGRTSILTGVPSNVSGVYGNMLWDGDRFRYAAPDDVRVPTLVARATRAGLRTACIGMGMVRPEDATVFSRPWWVGAFVQRARDPQPVTTEDAWQRVAGYADPSGALATAADVAGVPATFDTMPDEVAARVFAGFQGDQRVAQWVGALATLDDGPDLIVAEFLMTDTIQHRAGYKSDLALWSVSVADALVGDVLARLRAAGREDAFDVVVLSDHGHGPIERALRADVILPGMRFQSEGGLLHVAPRGERERLRAEAALAEHGVAPYPSAHVPDDARDHLATFLAPDGMAFEHDPTVEADGPVVPPVNRSSHGARPGHPSDERFLVAAGPNVERARIARADATAVEPTLAALLGLTASTRGRQPLLGATVLAAD